MPLTALTAYEMLFDRLRVADPVPGAANAVVIIGGSGGVVSIAIETLGRIDAATLTKARAILESNKAKGKGKLVLEGL